MNLYHVTKFSPYSPFTLYCFFTKIIIVCQPLFSILRNSQQERFSANNSFSLLIDVDCQNNREFKQIATATSTTAAGSKKAPK